MHSVPDLHMKSKKDNEAEINLQQGSGESNQSLENLLKDSKPLHDDDNPLEFNERKRKLLGSEIQDSFLHPTFVKTSKIILEPKANLKAPKSAKNMKKETIQIKNVKHKFKFD